MLLPANCGRAKLLQTMRPRCKNRMLEINNVFVLVRVLLVLYLSSLLWALVVGSTQ
jgi:hypothetical protein